MAGAAFVTDDSLVAGLSSPAATYQAAQDDGTALVTVTNDGKFALEYDRCDASFHVQLIEQADIISMNQASSEVLASLSDSDRAMVSAFVELSESKNEPNREQQLDPSAGGDQRQHRGDRSDGETLQDRVQICTRKYCDRLRPAQIHYGGKFIVDTRGRASI